jgi:hypothetical protein
MAAGKSVGKKQTASNLKLGFLLFLMLFFLYFPVANSQQLSAIRKEYYAATTDGREAEKLYVKLRQLKPSDPVLMAYYGSAQALKAKYSWNPYNKVSYLTEGRKTLRSAVAKSPENLEIRFLRYCLEYYLPAFLGMSDNLEADRKKIVYLIEKKQYGGIDEALLKNLISFLKQSKSCTSEELRVLAKAEM